MATFLCACGSSGGGTPTGTADVFVTNIAALDLDGVPDGLCSDAGAANTEDIVSVTVVRLTTPGNRIVVPLTPSLAPGDPEAFLVTLGPGIYSFEANYASSVSHETDQCPPDNVTLVVGTPVHVAFQR